MLCYCHLTGLHVINARVFSILGHESRNLRREQNNNNKINWVPQAATTCVHVLYFSGPARASARVKSTFWVKPRWRHRARSTMNTPALKVTFISLAYSSSLDLTERTKPRARELSRWHHLCSTPLEAICSSVAFAELASAPDEIVKACKEICVDNSFTHFRLSIPFGFPRCPTAARTWGVVVSAPRTSGTTSHRTTYVAASGAIIQ